MDMYLIWNGYKLDLKWMCILSLMNVFFISLQYEMDLIWMELRTTYNVLPLIKIYICLFWLSWSHYSVLTKNKNLALKIVSWIAHIKIDPNETKTDSPAICSQSLKLSKFFIVKVWNESVGISRQVLILKNGLGRSLFDRVVLVFGRLGSVDLVW